MAGFRFLGVALLGLLASSARASRREQAYTDVYFCGVINTVEDGDTLFIAIQAPQIPLPNGQAVPPNGEAGGIPLYKIRFRGVDTPEFHPVPDAEVPVLVQPWGEQARAFTAQFIGQEACIYPVDHSYNRIVASIYLMHPPQEWFDAGVDGDMSLALIRYGLGWWYANFTRDWAHYGRAQADAEAEHLNMWSGPERPQAPWDYRDSVRRSGAWPRR